MITTDAHYSNFHALVTNAIGPTLRHLLSVRRRPRLGSRSNEQKIWKIEQARKNET